MVFTNLFSLYLLSVTVIVIFWTVHVKTLNGSSYAKIALLLCFAVCFYILGYAMELNSTTRSQILFWNHIEYFGIPFVSALWLTTGLTYTGHFLRHKYIFSAAVFLIPLTTLILRYTNGLHHLYFSLESFIDFNGGLFFVKQAGIWMYVQLVHSSLMIIITMSLFIYDAVKSSEKQMGKILSIVAASAVAVTGLIFSLIKPFGFPIDYMALLLPVTCVMVVIAISRYDLLETKSIARSKAFDASYDAILLINRRYRILDYNGSAKQLFEKIDIRLENRYLSSLFFKYADLLESLKKTEPSLVRLKVNGHERYYDITTENIDDHNILRGWIKTIHDITKIHQLNEELKNQAMTDELSVLCNRRAFIKLGNEQIEKSEVNGNGLYLLMMDLDHFKTINDQYGHPIGDLVIREFAQLLVGHFSSHCLIARLGGEEFAVMLPGCDDDIINHQRAFLKTAAEHEYRFGEYSFHITVSVGVTKRQPGQLLESMMKKADRALYQSKDQGRNCVTVL